MIWVIGFILDKITFYNGRFRAKYYLHKFGAHGNNVQIENGCNITAPNIFVGNNIFIGEGATFLSTNARIIMGNNIMIGPNVSIVTGNHRTDIIGKYMIDISCEDKRPTDDEDVVIDDDVWIGMNAIILKGVHIGKGSIIGAGTIVSKDIEPYSIVKTERSTIIKQRFSKEEIIRHEKLIKERLGESD